MAAKKTDTPLPAKDRPVGHAELVSLSKEFLRYADTMPDDQFWRRWRICARLLQFGADSVGEHGQIELVEK